MNHSSRKKKRKQFSVLRTLRRTGKYASGILISIFLISGCSKYDISEAEKMLQENSNTKKEQLNVIAADIDPDQEEQKALSDEQEETTGEPLLVENKSPEPEIVETDWSEYFSGLNGAAVVYNPSEERYSIYNKDLAMTRRSPCSTFKIISSLIALEEGVIESDNSLREWSGEIFWNENWNHDIDFQEAFQSSCVWYFREVVDEIGQEVMQAELERLLYGNCDISDWEGGLNTNNNNRALTGFWIESSLKISSKEQTEVMERIFGNNSIYSEDTVDRLRQVMLVSESDTKDIAIYGKTGMGKVQGVVVDAWFTGFAGTPQGNLYFCVYLGQSDGMEVSSAIAKEIAIQIISNL